MDLTIFLMSTILNSKIDRSDSCSESNLEICAKERCRFYTLPEISCKATADSGNEITYVATKTAAGKITVSKAGKITVKKGLKKGTYKVTVKAKTAAGNGYKAASEKQTYTIVVKK